MTQHDVQAYRETLVRLVARLRGDVSHLREVASGPSRAGADAPDGTPVDQADPASRIAEEDVALTILGSEEQVLRDATAALARIDAGTFGKCERCGKAITKARLEALPYARHCITCAQAVEAGGR